MKRIFAIILAVLLLSTALVGCSKTVSSGTVEKSSSSQSTEKEKETVKQEAKATDALLNIDDIEKSSVKSVDADYQKKAPEKGETIAVIKTSYGDISFRFFNDVAPLATNNFIALAKEGRYDNTIFHRVIANFMIQGGDYTKFNGTGGVSAYGKEFDNEVVSGVSNCRGAVSMANAGPNTNGSQFYINQVDNTYLDGNYTVFGQVFDGLDVVDKIAKVKTGANDKPQTDVILESVEIKEYEG
ncbi:MAG: peptidylprolyl isomerase [Oscillospiraceae bacterium]|nr:peptidylprolyl isomerase [Candidatus Ruminococcus equi]